MPDKVLDLDSAVSVMQTAPASPGTSPWNTMSDAPSPELPPEEKKEDKLAAATAETGVAEQPAGESARSAEAATDPAKSADESNQAVQADAPATTDGKDEQGSLPPIEPPSSWKAEAKEVFKSLPRAAQEEIARREQDRTTELRNLQNTAAEQRKAADGEVARLKGLADRMEQTITNQVNDLAREFPEIKTQADIDALAANDPAKFSRFQAALMRFNATQQAQADAQRELKQKQEQQVKDAAAASYKELVKHFPTWADVKVAQKEIKDLQDYAIGLGVPEQAARTSYDPILYRMAHKAMLYDRAQAAAKAAVDREPARVVNKPGTTTTPREQKDAKAAAERKAAIAKLDKSGDIMDAVGLMMQ